MINNKSSISYDVSLVPKEGKKKQQQHNKEIAKISCDEFKRSR